ncbi:hypothetical protein AOXY_G21980 [Acipenser oxyrinchus oxyrinchus]|uniref:Uncharacterized protein n=1 Tax=Acipenser oxyrinchus oxyrinchus TaxID=40147 RepID=A0AAD8CYQ3_ACIOX|nr:hypothetical protein AOXY_G21980 [Acipenser oxyrinchus oxyrinchus]
MVTLITEQLQKQSLDDPKCRAFNLSLSVPDHSSTGVCWNPFKPGRVISVALQYVCASYTHHNSNDVAGKQIG